MLSKQYRLKNKRAFDATYRQRRIFSDRLLLLYAGSPKTNEIFETKFGFVVSKKYHKRAVKRNRIKRLMREACRLMIKNGFKCNSRSVIFMPKSCALDADFKSVQESVKRLFTKL